MEHVYFTEFDILVDQLYIYKFTYYDKTIMIPKKGYKIFKMFDNLSETIISYFIHQKLISLIFLIIIFFTGRL